MATGGEHFFPFFIAILIHFGCQSVSPLNLKPFPHLKVTFSNL